MNLSSCHQEIEYRLDTEFVFVNESDKMISFDVWNSINKKVIALDPNSSDTVFYKASGDFEKPDPSTCCQGVLNSLFYDSGLNISMNDSLCLLSSPLFIDNYVSEKVDNRYFRYTFTFTNEILDDVSSCH